MLQAVCIVTAIFARNITSLDIIMGNPGLLGKVFVTAVLLVLVVVPASGKVSFSQANNNCTKFVARNHSVVCPTWLFPSSEDGKECECGPDFKKAIHCRYHSTSSLKIAYCMTYNETSKLTSVGQCPYNTNAESKLFHPLPKHVEQLNEKMCGPLNRTGLLCSQCQRGLGPAVFSPYRECLECMDEPYGWILFFFMATFPQTILCLFVIIFRINAASPSLNGFVLAAQIITNIINTTPSNNVNGNHIVNFLSKFIATCYGFWNLDFFSYLIPSFCIRKGMSTLNIIALEYTVVLSPIFFTVVVYYCITLHDNGCRVLVCCWRPFQRCFIRFRGSWELKGSVINAFVTFLLLSYSKICSISFSLMQSVQVSDICGYLIHRVYYDMSYERLSKHHLHYVTPASIVVIVFVCLPALFVLFYQNKVFQKCLNFCKFKCVLIHELANICQGCFKNGTTPGTRDYRWFAGLYLMLRIVIIAMVGQKYYPLILVVVPCIMAVLVAIVRPYRIDFYNKLDSVFWMFFTIGSSWYVYTVASENLTPEGIKLFFLIPLVYMIGFVAWRLITCVGRKCRPLIAKRKKLSSTTDREGINTEDDQLPDRLLQPSEYTPLISSSKHLAPTSDTQQSVQSNQCKY